MKIYRLSSKSTYGIEPERQGQLSFKRLESSSGNYVKLKMSLQWDEITWLCCKNLKVKEEYTRRTEEIISDF